MVFPFTSLGAKAWTVGASVDRSVAPGTVSAAVLTFLEPVPR